MSSPKKPKPAIEKEAPKKKGKTKRDTGRAADLPGLHGEPIPSDPGKTFDEAIDEASAKPAKKSRANRRAERRARASLGTTTAGAQPAPAEPPSGPEASPGDAAGGEGGATVKIGVEGSPDVPVYEGGPTRPLGVMNVAGPDLNEAKGDDRARLLEANDGRPLARVGDLVHVGGLTGVVVPTDSNGRSYATSEDLAALTNGAHAGDDAKPVRVKADNAGALGLQLTDDQIRRANEHGAVYARIGGGPYFYKVEGESEARWHKSAPVLHEVVSSGPKREPYQRAARPPVDFGSLSLADAMNALEAARDLTDAVDESFDLPISQGVPRLRAALEGARAAGILPPPGARHVSRETCRAPGRPPEAP